MFDKLMVGRTNLLLVSVAVFIAALLTLSLSTAAFAAVGMQADKGSLQGEVVAVSHVHNANTLTLRSSQIGQFPNDKLNVFLTQNTKVKVCNTNEPFRDINVGRGATVTYHELGGVAVADSISENC